MGTYGQCTGHLDTLLMHLYTIKYGRFPYQKTEDKEIGMATARLDMKLDQVVKDKATKASALLNKRSLTEYIVQLVDEDATRVIAQHESISVNDNVFDRFMLACENAPRPNKALLNAVKFTREKGFE